NAILSSDLIQAIYDSLLSIPEIDENLEGDTGFFFEYCVNFTELLNFQEGNLSDESAIANKLIGYVQADSGKKSRKYLEKDKQRDTIPRLSRYDCNGNVSIKIDYENNFAIITMNHQLLHT
ncbi:27931_t:CDS:2, partial [Racocetra persica]